MLAVAGATRTLRTIRANCRSGDCSLVTLEFDSTTAGTAGSARSVRMRATALLRYDEEHAGFRVFHWHASPAAAVSGR
jgi:hypothetical protein